MIPNSSSFPLDPVLYHAHHILRADDLSFWQTLGEEYGDPILELGCGTGRILLSLASAGKIMTGLDTDPNMLAYLRTAIPSQGLPDITILQADMRTFHLGERFALAILPCNTYSTFPSHEREQIAQAVFRHLHPGGVFALSVPNPLLLASLELVGDFDLEESFPHPQTGHPVEVFSKWERTPAMITFTWQYNHRHPNGNTTTHAITSHHLDTPEMYLEELQRAGLTPVELYGDYQRAAFDPEDSTYLIILAQNQTS
jgi:SAM-dependent methyltransferase